MGYAVGREKDGGVRVSTGGGTGYVKRQSKKTDSPSFNSQQIRAIKKSPAGKLPKFLSSYNRPTLDNRITNAKVRAGKLPKSQLEIYPQKKK